MPKKKQSKNEIKKIPTEAKGLTDKQARFAEEYIIDCNGKQAAIRAGYSEASAGPTASTLLKHSGVKRYISFLTAKHAEKLNLNTQAVLEELSAIGFVDHGSYYDQHGNAIPLDDLTPFQRKAIRDVKFKVSSKKGEKTKREVSSYSFYNKVESLTKLANHLGMVIDKPNREVEEKKADDSVSFEKLMKNLEVDQLKQLTEALESAQEKADSDNVFQFKKKNG